ncbi:MAG: peptidoglycan DD-metalloendopeptidase family protein [Elusimicrobia bacterium]|nr:peptidoglycan DD-metalloendopeptidase family protein [Elusimicrobiota bacterium]
MMGRVSAVLVFGLAVSLMSVRAATDPVKSKQESLKKIQSEIKVKNKEKELAARKAGELRREVEQASKELQAARRALRETGSRLDEAEKNRADAEARLLSSYQDLREWRVRLSSGIQNYYVRWSLSGEGSLPSLMYEGALLRERTAQLKFAQENHKNVEVLRDELSEAEQHLRRVQAKKQGEELQAEVARNRLKQLQKTEDGRRMVLERQIEELNASAKKFEKWIADLILKEKREQARRAKARKTNVARAKEPRGLGQKWRGQLHWPVAGPVVEKFGRKVDRDMGVPTVVNGITLRPDAQSVVGAAQAGDVLFAGPFMNYGLMALVSHLDGIHTIYAHLGGLQVTRGQPVAAGQTVGVPGRDDEGRPTVYFEVRMDGEPVNPEGWLKPEMTRRVTP